jgi:hypothetical protein
MLTFLFVLASMTPTPEHSDSPGVASCIAAADRPSGDAHRAIAARRYALASHLFAVAAGKYDACARSLAPQWNPGDALLGADRLLWAGQAAHLAGDASRARQLVESALHRFIALEHNVPQPEIEFYQNLRGSRESAENDLRGTWTVF